METMMDAINEINEIAEKKVSEFLGVPTGIVAGFFLGETFSGTDFDQNEIDRVFNAAIISKGFIEYYNTNINQHVPFDTDEVFISNAEARDFLVAKGAITVEEGFALELN